MIKMNFQAAVEYKGKVFFSDISGFGLFSYDLNTFEVKCCCMFDEVDCFALHRKAFIYKNEAWFIPQSGRVVTVINLDTFDIERLEIPFRKCVNRMTIMHSDGVITNGKLFCIPYDIDTLSVFDIETRTITNISNFIDPEKEKVYSVSIDDDEIVLYPYLGDDILFINTIDYTCRKETRFDVQGDYSEVVKFGGRWYLAPGKKGELCLIEDNKKRIVKKYKEEEDAYYGHCFKEDRLVLFPYSGNSILILGAGNDGGVDAIEIENDLLLNKHVLFEIPSKDRLLLSDSFNSAIIDVDINNRIIKPYYVFADSSDLEKQRKSKMDQDSKYRIVQNSKNIMIEDGWRYSLDDLLDYVKYY